MPLTQIGEVYLAVCEADGPVLWCDTVFPYISRRPPKNTKGGRQRGTCGRARTYGARGRRGQELGVGGGGGQREGHRGRRRGGGGGGGGSEHTHGTAAGISSRVEQAYNKCPVPEMAKDQLDQVMD